MFGPVRVQPETRYTAEVVVLVTSLGAKRTEFNAGKRAKDLLEIKGVHHKIIDFNRDARQAGTGESENKAISKLSEDGKLRSGTNNDLILPQVFIDGQFVGNATDLQGLEDDGLLDNILMRKACPSCNSSRRTPDITECKRCPACWEPFQEILPGEMTIKQKLQEFHDLHDDVEYDEDEEEEPFEDDMMHSMTAMPTDMDGRSRSGYGDARAGVQYTPEERAILAAAEFQISDQVQYWSDSRHRWMCAVVDNIRLKDCKVVYDLNCKRGAQADKIKAYEDAEE
ncbi:unnamed protein product [Cladocopium goreaui]|uniref:Glutaredoxin domain-containing protein n=1 Tax=Cladocopium goreaui TaxID=2562237 RepID=A0A9P1M2I4_9DINO|nr:unnamed protein product [Cladocopium goreaui]